MRSTIMCDSVRPGRWGRHQCTARVFISILHLQSAVHPTPSPQPCVHCPIHLSMAAEHGHRGGVTGIERRARPSALSTIASAHCARRVSLPGAELELLIRVSPCPRIFRREPSADAAKSLRTRPGPRTRPHCTHVLHELPVPVTLVALSM